MPKLLPDDWTLPESLRRRVGTSIGRQRAMFDAGHALLLVHRPPRGGERERRALVLHRDPEGAWRGAPGPSGPAALRGAVEAYAARLAELEAQLARASVPRERYAVLRESRPLARAARNFHAALQEVRTAIPEDADVLLARDRAYDLERESAALFEEASAALQLGLAEDADEQSSAAARIAVESHRLNLLAAICLPVTALGSILGMNLETGVEHVPGPWLFVAVVGSAFAIGLALHAWIRGAPARSTSP